MTRSCYPESFGGCPIRIFRSSPPPSVYLPPSGVRESTHTRAQHRHTHIFGIEPYHQSRVTVLSNFTPLRSRYLKRVYRVHFLKSAVRCVSPEIAFTSSTQRKSSFPAAIMREFSFVPVHRAPWRFIFSIQNYILENHGSDKRNERRLVGSRVVHDFSN